MLEGTGKTFTERVRLFDPHDLAALLSDCGFVVTDMCGDYDGTRLTERSPRAILIARRPR